MKHLSSANLDLKHRTRCALYKIQHAETATCIPQAENDNNNDYRHFRSQKAKQKLKLYYRYQTVSAFLCCLCAAW